MKNKTTTTIIMIIAFFAGYFAIKGVIHSVRESQTPTISPVAIENTYKNSFVEGCKQTIGNVPNPEGACVCLYDKLKAYLGNQMLDTNWQDRVLREGYNADEVKQMAQCSAFYTE